MNAATNELSARIHAGYNRMSKGQKRLADYILENYEKAVYLTAGKLGTVVGVSESTVVRFAGCLGYGGYPEFQKALEEMVRNRLNSIQRMEVTYGRISESEILNSVLLSDAHSSKRFFTPVTVSMLCETALPDVSVLSAPDEKPPE